MVLYLLPERLVSKPYIQEPEHREKSFEGDFFLFKEDRHSSEHKRSNEIITSSPRFS